MIGSYLGETASRLKRVFDYARTTPCVLFFDEFDAVGKERGDIHDENRRDDPARDAWRRLVREVFCPPLKNDTVSFLKAAKPL